MHVRRLGGRDAVDIAGWHYPGRESTYDVLGEVSSEDGYWAVEDDGALVGYCCFGHEARVSGVEPEDGTLDVGYGMRPDLAGAGTGREFVRAILTFGLTRFDPDRLRLLILEWNERSRRVAEALGFVQTGSVTNDQGVFLVMLRD